MTLILKAQDLGLAAPRSCCKHAEILRVWSALRIGWWHKSSAPPSRQLEANLPGRNLPNRDLPGRDLPSRDLSPTPIDCPYAFNSGRRAPRCHSR